MVVKPVTLIALATLVIAAAGAGAYLAVRDNSAPVDVTIAPAAGEGGIDPAGDAVLPAATEAVEATEQVISDEGDQIRQVQQVDQVDEVDEVDEDDKVDDQPKTDATRVPSQTKSAAPPRSSAQEQATRRSDADRPTSEPRAQNRSPQATATERDRPPSAPQASARDLPEAPGWERRSKPLPSRDEGDDESGQPDQVSLRPVALESLGTQLLPEEPPPVFEELILRADSVIGLQVDAPVSSDTAEVEDDVEARVSRDVMVSNRVAIPAGTRVLGSVVLVERAGQFKGASRLGVRFHTLVLDDVIEVPVVTETVYREGQARGGKSAAKIGGAAIGGAILGAIFGGGRGAAIGGAAGAAGGTAAAMAGDGEAAMLVAGTSLTVRLSRPATVTVGP